MSPSLKGARSRLRHESRSLGLRGRYALRTRRPLERRLAAQVGGSKRLAWVVDSWRGWSPRPFFFGRGEASQIAGQLDAEVPGWRDATVAAADRLVRNEVRLLGHEVQLGADIPWHRDFVNGYEWDATSFYRSVEIPYGKADIKVPWELSRFQHLPTLGMAYLVTRDQAYAAHAIGQIDDWISANPEARGVNWAGPMDAAIRAVNWLWAYHFIPEAEAFTEPFAVRFVGSLLAHGEHIRSNVEVHAGGMTTNHTIANMVGLFFLGACLPELAVAGKWRTAAQQGLESCMRTQVMPDGAHFESSISYHRLVLEMFATAHLLGMRSGHPFSDAYRDRLSDMFGFVRHYLRADGTAPLVGDNDNGRLQILDDYFDWKVADHRHLLALGGAVARDREMASQGLSSRSSFAEVAWMLPAADRKWLLSRGDDAQRPPSTAFRHSGRHVLSKEDHHALVCTDPVGSAGHGTHKHNDVLSYDLSVDGRPLVVDPGTYLYTSSLEWRDYFRGTRAHNTVVVDGAEQNRPNGWFAMHPDAAVSIHRWQPGTTVDVLEASHTGYERLAEPVAHRRRVVLAGDPFAWLVLDELTGEGTHEIESSLHLASGATAQEAEGLLRAERDTILRDLLPALRAAEIAFPWQAALRAADAALSIAGPEAANLILVPLRCPPPQIDRGWIAPAYGVKASAPVLRFAHRVECGDPFGYLIARKPAS